MRRAGAIAAAGLFAALVIGGQSQSADVRAGERFARENCANCHAIGRSGASPNRRSPPLRVIARKYKLQDLEEGLAEGIVTGHNAMPEFTLTPRQIDDLLAHLRQLRRR